MLKKLLLVGSMVALLAVPSSAQLPIRGGGTPANDGSAYDVTADADRMMLVNSSGVAQTLAFDPCASTPNSVMISTAAAGNTQLVAISGSTVVYVCGYNVVADGTVAVQFVEGLSTTCTTPVDKTGAMSFVANGGINTGFSGSTVFKTTAGRAVCIELSAAVGARGILSYVQQ